MASKKSLTAVTLAEGSAEMSAPWTSLLPVSVVAGLCGLGQLIYGGLTFFRARQQNSYEPVWEDWLWFNVLPCVMHVALVIAAVLLKTTTEVSLFVIGATALGQLFIGIHNAWDSVTYIVVSHSPSSAGTAEESTSEP